MAPNAKDERIMQTGFLEEGDDFSTEQIPEEMHKPDATKQAFVWTNIIALFSMHVYAPFGLYAVFTSARWATVLWAFVIYQLGLNGLTAGAHRLWSHKSFKAKWQLKLILVIIQAMAHQESVLSWARNHRLHHKYQDTDADPYNPQRGFFFAHMGWLMVRKHPEVKIKGAGMDMSDLYNDPFVRFQHKYFVALMLPLTFIIPTVVPMYFWNETFSNAFSLNIFRYVVTMNSIWFVNSIAHRYGMRPFDKHIWSAENWIVSVFTGGEAWHNYHHTFPWDYKTSEVDKFNIAKYFIEFFAKIGWAYELKSVSEDMLKKRVQRTGDGSHVRYGTKAK